MDKCSQEYLSRHPEAAKKQTSLIKEHFDPVDLDDEPGTSDLDLSDADDSMEDGDCNQTKQKSKIPRSHVLAYLEKFTIDAMLMCLLVSHIVILYCTHCLYLFDEFFGQLMELAIIATCKIISSG